MWIFESPEKRRRKYEEGRETFFVTIDGRTITGKEGTFPSGIFPMPRFIRRWAGFRN